MTLSTHLVWWLRVRKQKTDNNTKCPPSPPAGEKWLECWERGGKYICIPLVIKYYFSPATGRCFSKAVSWCFTGRPGTGKEPTLPAKMKPDRASPSGTMVLGPCQVPRVAVSQIRRRLTCHTPVPSPKQNTNSLCHAARLKPSESICLKAARPGPRRRSWRCTAVALTRRRPRLLSHLRRKKPLQECSYRILLA